jgi:hypothetical protein
MKTQSLTTLACAATVLMSTAVSLKATVWTVSTLNPTGPGSLHDSVAASAPGDTVQFAVTGTIFLTSAINIPHTLYVQGPGPSLLTVDAGFADRAFVVAGNPVIISGMTITHGMVTGVNGADGGLNQDGQPGGPARGGAILDINSVSDTLVLSNCWITGNTVIGGHGGRGGSIDAFFGSRPGNGGSGGIGWGGAVYFAGYLTNINCTFSQNRAFGGAGGDGGNCTNVSITAGKGGIGGTGEGGAVSGYRPDNTNCTFSANTVTGGAGGPGGSCIPGSVGPGGAGGAGAHGEGGAINVFVCHLMSSTIVSNSAFAGAGGLGGNGSPSGANGTLGPGNAGGVKAYIMGGCLNIIANTILADNYADTDYTNYYAEWTDFGYNFIGSLDYPSCGFGPTSQVGTVPAPIHPQLGALAQNGGGLPTHKVTLSGPVIDKGYSFGLTTDERGAPRPYSFGLPWAPGGDGSDIGAFERGSTDLGGTQSNTNMVLSWPAYYGDLVPQSATNLLGTHNWSYMSVFPVQVGNQLIVTDPMTNKMMFYRLISQ